MMKGWERACQRAHWEIRITQRGEEKVRRASLQVSGEYGVWVSGEKEHKDKPQCIWDLALLLALTLTSSETFV